MIKDKEWLKSIRKQEKITQQQLANALELSVNTLAKIEQGQREGSEETWKKINSYFKKEIMAGKDELITRLENDIQKYGNDLGCILTYKLKNKTVYFIDYRVDIGNVKSNQELKGTLKQALEIFRNQGILYEKE